jgi:hypothetical protein
MSLLAHGPHTVTVYLEVEVTDSRGNTVRRPSTTGVVVTGCTMHPVASTRGAFPALDARRGQKVDSSWRLLARDAPLGWWSRVEFQGRVMTPLSGPLRYTASDGTTHVSCTLREER